MDWVCDVRIYGGVSRPPAGLDSEVAAFDCFCALPFIPSTAGIFTSNFLLSFYWERTASLSVSAPVIQERPILGGLRAKTFSEG